MIGEETTLGTLVASRALELGPSVHETTQILEMARLYYPEVRWDEEPADEAEIATAWRCMRIAASRWIESYRPNAWYYGRFAAGA